MAFSHRTGVIRTVVNALRKTFDSGYLDDAAFQNLYIGTEFSGQQEKIPGIIVRYNETTVRNSGLGDYVTWIDDEGQQHKARRWFAQGGVTFSILAMNPYERDLLMDALVNALGVGRYYTDTSPLFEEMWDDDFIILEPNTENLRPGSTGTQPTPWESQDEQVYTGQYFMDVIAEFYSDMEMNDLVSIRQVNVYPYRPDQMPDLQNPGDSGDWI